MAPAYTLVYKAPYTGEPQYDEWGAEITPPEPTSVVFEVHLEPTGRGNEAAQQGYDPTTVDYNDSVVRTPYDTLTLPPGVGAGTTFPLTVRGKKGTLTIGAAPDDTMPELVADMGESFKARWNG